MNSFDWQYYISLYDDLKLCNINTQEKAYEHWLLHGKNENRICTKDENFDWKYYVNLYPDLQNDNMDTELKALKHWLLHGKNENRICTKDKNFDWKYYVNLYPDLQNNNIDTELKALQHWLLHGKNENRKSYNSLENILCEENIIISSDKPNIKETKKNIAILFSGQIRSNSLSLNKNNNDLILNSMNINFINNEFKNKYNYDIFISSDEIDVDKTINYFDNNVKNIFLSNSNYYLHNITKHIDSYEHIYHKYMSRNYDNYRIYPNSVMQFYRLYNCYNMMINYKNYDYIIRSRFDVIYQHNIMNYMNMLDSDKNIQYFGCTDFFGVGRIGIMEYYCKMVDNKYGLYINNNLDDDIRWRYAPEVQLAECLNDYCITNNYNPHISIKNMHDFCAIYRG